MEVTVAIDCMGGDHGAHVTVPAALDYLERDPQSSFILVGLQDRIEAELERRRATPGPRLKIRHASEIVEIFFMIFPPGSFYLVVIKGWYR